MTHVNRSQQIEFETFPKDEKPNYSYLSAIKEDANNASPSYQVVFSQQSIIVVLICVLLSLVATFTLGVEKGKLVGRNSILAQKTQETQALPTPAAAPAAEAKKTAVASVSGNEIQPTLDAAPASPKEEAIAGGYVIQVASVKSQPSAKRLVETLIQKGVPSFSKQSGNYIVVLAGNFAEREEAQTKLRELKKTYNDCFIKKI
ncbi:MAG: SPOR domain-containing protein [Candidatus Omnitrophota bacterium]